MSEVSINRELIEALASRTLLLECPEITLTQNRKSDPEVIRGRGSIACDPEGPKFRLTVYADPGTEQLRDLMSNLSGQGSGTLISDEEYYRLDAVDFSGVAWHWERVFLNRSSNFSTGHAVIHAELDSLRQVSACDLEIAEVAGIFFGPTGVIHNQMVRTEVKAGQETQTSFELKGAEFEAEGFNFKVRPLDLQGEPSVIRVTFPAGRIPDGAEYRVLEALQYATFRPLSWIVLIKMRDGRREITVSPPTAARPPLLRPPTVSRDPTHAKNFWTLVACYLQHVIAFADSEHYSPLSAQLRALISAETRELVVLAQLVTAAVEGVLNIEYKTLAEPTKEFKDALDVVRGKIGMLDVDPGIITRVQGAIEPMKSARASDKLKALVSVGLVTEEQFRAWTKLRNASAHASINPHSYDTQKLWQHCNGTCQSL